MNRTSALLVRLARISGLLAAVLCIALPVHAQPPIPPDSTDGCEAPGWEPLPATQPICNVTPVVTLKPAGVLMVSQPSVPITLHAFDHFSEQNFASFRIVVDDTVVTSSWSVTTADTAETRTSHGRHFRATGQVALSASRPQRTISVTLCDTLQACDTETGVYTLGSPGVTVTPDAEAGSVQVAATRTTTFTVKNTGAATATFNLSPDCITQGGDHVTPCSVSPGSVSLAAGDSATATVTFPAGTAGAALSIKLNAVHADAPGVRDGGWRDLVVRSFSGSTEAPPTVALVPLNSAANVERGQCVTVATAPGGAYECGNLRIAHGLPPHRTLGRTWAPALLYSSQHAHPRPTVYADVTVPDYAAVPTLVSLVLTLEDGTVRRAYFAGSSFLPGLPRRIGLQWDALDKSTGVYGYTLQVVSHYPNNPKGSFVLSGEVAIVNRSGSAYGAGWWLAGWEQVRCIEGCGAYSTSRMLWIGGDGSTRVFEPHATQSQTWTAQSPDGAPDTLRLGTGGYKRVLPGGGYVLLDAQGRHTQTVNRLGQATRFDVDTATGWVTRIRPPYPGAGTSAPVRPVSPLIGPTGAWERVAAAVLGASGVIAVLVAMASGQGWGALRDGAIPCFLACVLLYVGVTGRDPRFLKIHSSNGANRLRSSWHRNGLPIIP